MQTLLRSHRPQAARKPCSNSHNRVHGRKLVSAEGGDCSKPSFFGAGLVQAQLHDVSHRRVLVSLLAAPLGPKDAQLSLAICMGSSPRSQRSTDNSHEAVLEGSKTDLLALPKKAPRIPAKLF